MRYKSGLPFDAAASVAGAEAIVANWFRKKELGYLASCVKEN